MSTDRAGGGRHGESVRAPASVHLDGGHLRVRANRRPGLHRTESEERGSKSRIGVPLLRAERRAREIRGEIRSKGAEVVALEDLDLEPGLLLDHALLVQEPEL